MEVAEIQVHEVEPILHVLNQTFDTILRNYNSLLFAIKDSAGMEVLKMADDELQSKGIDISHFPNRDLLQFYITHYVREIPAVARLQQYLDKKGYPKIERNQEQVKEERLEARLGLNSKLFLVQESENGIQRILMGWAMLQFVIENPNRISVATMEQLMEYGYQGTCGTTIMKEMCFLIEKVKTLEDENALLKKEIMEDQNKTKKLD